MVVIYIYDIIFGGSINEMSKSFQWKAKGI